MALLDDLKTAATDALSAGASAARAQGTALKGDFETLVKPNLDAIVVQIESITQDRINGIIGDDQARNDLNEQLARIQPLVLAMAELSLLAVQNIINAVLAALTAVINKAIGFPLL